MAHFPSEILWPDLGPVSVLQQNMHTTLSDDGSFVTKHAHNTLR